ncbi:hypothetical protein ACIRNU_12245 [Streptomyces rochei]|uniref:hypothetical protein n=1 Tax=Streptomyces rochei TaxID=1928 RepID=UPI003817D879
MRPPVGLALRARYEAGFRDLIDSGVAAGRFQATSARLAGESALRLVGAKD